MANTPELELGSGERVVIDGALVIGRSTEADLVIPDPEASRRHALIRVEGDSYLVSDLESRNGTLVNGEPLVEPRPLRDGDEILIGKTSIVFRLAAPAPAASPPPIEPTVQMPSIAMSPMQVLGRISRQISGIVDAKQLADAVTEAIKDEYGCEGASLILIDEEADELYFASVASSEAVTLRLMTLKRGQGIAGDVIERKAPVVVSDVSRAVNHAGELDRALGFTSRSIVAAPVFGPGGEVLGALEAVNPLRKPAFDEDDMEFISLVAGQLGVALINARSWDAIERERSALSKVAGIRRDFVAVSPATLRIVVEVAGLHAARTPVYLGGEPGTGKRLLVRLTHATSGDPGQLVELSGPEGLPADIDRLIAGSAVHVTGLEGTSMADQERLAAAISGHGDQPVYVSGTQSLLSLLSAGRLSPALHAVLESGQRVIPPLRARLDELEPLVEHLVADVAARLRRDQFTFSPDAFARFREYGWPGNVAELDALVRRIGILSRDAVVDLPVLDELAPELLSGGGLDGGAERLGAIERKLATRLAAANEQLQAPDASKRLEAVAMLGSLAGESATESLVAALVSTDPGVRTRAAHALASRPGTSEALAARLETESEPGVGAAILAALAATGEGGHHESVTRALLALDPAVRREAIRTLRLTRSQALAAAAQRAAGDADARVRAEGLAAMHTLGDADAESRLTAMLDDPVAETAAASAEICGELGLGLDRLCVLAVEGEPLVRVAAIRALGGSKGDQTAGRTLLEALEDPTMRVEAIHALAELEAVEASPRLTELAADVTAPMAARKAALKALARFGGAANLTLLLDAMHTPELADAATDGLIVLAAPEGEDALAGQLAASPARTGDIAEALGKWGTARSVGPLLAAGASAPFYELQVLQALVAICGRVKEREALFRELSTALEQEQTRLLGLQLLGELRDPMTAPLLLRYRDWSQEARLALSRLGPAAMTELLQALQTADRDAAEETLAEIGTAGVPHLLPLLGSPDLGRAAARVIQAVGEAALPALLDAAEKRQPATLPMVLQLIGRIGAGRLASYVTTFLESPDAQTRYAAIVALGDLPDARGEAELLNLVESRDTITSGLAMLALGRTQSARGFEILLSRVAARADRRLQYANAAAIANFNLRQPPVLALIAKTVREGLPFSSAAMEAGFRAGALTTDDILSALTSASVSASQKLRLVAVLGRMPGDVAIPALHVLLASSALPESLLSSTVASLVRHESAATEEILALLRDGATRGRGLVVLEAMQEPRALITVLRSLGPALDEDEPLRRALREKGDQLLGPLLDVLYENWDLASLGLLWQLGEVVVDETGSRPAQL